MKEEEEEEEEEEEDEASELEVSLYNAQPLLFL